MTPSFFVADNVPDLVEVRIYDNSVFDSDTPIWSINATRLMFASVNSVNQIQTDVKSLMAFKLYVVESGFVEINGVTYSAGDNIYLANDTAIGETGVVNETGYYGQRSTYIPLNGNYVAYTPSQMLLLNQAAYTDNVITLNYFLYKTKYAAGNVSVSDRTQFIVTGTAGDSISIGSETYYVGEFFYKSSNFSFSNISGTNHIVKLENSTTNNFRTWGENWNLWERYFNKISTSYQVNQELLGNFLFVTARINQCATYEDQQFGVSLQGVQDLMNNVNQSYQI